MSARNACLSLALWLLAGPALAQTVTRTYAYNAHQELCRVQEPETGATLMGYDGAGNLAWSASGLPQGTNCDDEGDTTEIVARKAARTYDARNRIATLSFPDLNGNQSWSYTPDGLPASVTTYNDGGTTSVVNSYGYNKRRMLTAEYQQSTYTWGLSYVYDANAHPSTLVYPDALSIAFAPNALGQPTKAGSYATGVQYYPNGAIKQFTYGNGIVHTLTQNARGLPDRSQDLDGTTPVHDDSYDYDPVGNVLAISDAVSGNRGDRDMVYDHLNRLTSATSPMFGTATYAYDVLDNLRHVTVTGGTQVRDQDYVYDQNNRLTNITAGGATVVGLGYDVQGNLANKSGVTYAFDYGNRMRSGGPESYRYDAYGRRVQGARLSMYSQSEQLLYDSSTYAHDYIYLGGSLVATRARNTGTDALETTYQHTDALGSPVAVTDANKTVLQRSEYEPYGALLNRPMEDGPGYTGHVTDAATGLVYMQQRYYDPLCGCFLSVDPATAYSPGGVFNLYWYANASPYHFTDPDGRAADCPAQGTCVVRGTPQSTGTAGHAEASQNIGEQMKASGQYAEIHYNRAQSSVAGTASAGNQRADVAGVTHTGQIDTVEITSPSQTAGQMDAKGAAMQGKLAPEVQGVHKTYSIAEGLAPKAPLPRGGSALGVAGFMSGLVNALVGLKQNPNMSQAEFLTRATGIYPLAVQEGLVPPPTPPPQPQHWD